MQTGWLAPNGDFYKCSLYEHIDTAIEIVEKLNMCCPVRHFADKLLMDNGWVQITRSLLGVKEQSIYWDKFLTEAQKTFLRPYFEENDENVSYVSKLLWEKAEDK